MPELGTGAVLPRYKCHKEVFALKITEITLPPMTNDDPQENPAGLLKVEGGFAPIVPPVGFFARGGPAPGDYWIRYDDGYESWSPAKAFESGYERIA